MLRFYSVVLGVLFLNISSIARAACEDASLHADLFAEVEALNLLRADDETIAEHTEELGERIDAFCNTVLLRKGINVYQPLAMGTTTKPLILQHGAIDHLVAYARGLLHDPALTSCLNQNRIKRMQRARLRFSEKHRHQDGKDQEGCTVF